MTMVPAQTTLSKQEEETQILLHLQYPCHTYYGGFYGGSSYSNNYNNSSNIGLMSRLQGYECSSTIGQANCIGSGGGGGGGGRGSNHHHRLMADQDESRTNSDLNEEAGSSSKEALQEERDEGWLQLSIGSSSSNQNNIVTRISTQEETKSDHIHDPQVDPIGARRAPGELLELDLLQRGGGGSRTFMSPSGPAAPPNTLSININPPRPPGFMSMPGGGGAASTATSSFSTSSLFFQHHPGSSSSLYPHPPPPLPPPHHLPPFHQQEINWAFRPLLHSFAAAPSSSSSSSSSSLIPLGTYFSRPFQLHGGGRLDVPVPCPEFRVIDPPRRPFSSIWFMLQASQNQAKEPFLPQISKSYLRIKDGRMTVRLLLKYLVNKLRLDSESEIEITCRGQQLLPILTLQQVRDNIWSPREAVTLLPDSSTTDHIMVLHYGRSA